jgi:hypothetical protein
VPLSGAEAAALRTLRRASSRDWSDIRQRFLHAATADGTGGSNVTGVRWWLKFCLFGRSTLPFTRLTADSPLAEKLAAEELFMDFAVWLAVCKPSGRAISVRTIRKYLSQVRAWHLRHFRTHLCGDLDYKQMTDLLKGICRHVTQPPKLRRWGVRTQDLAEAIRRFLSSGSVEDENWRAALEVAFCGLLRAAEFGVQDGEEFDPARHLTRADVSFRRDSEGREYAVVRMRPAKGAAGQAKSVPLILGGGGSLLDPVRALRRLFAADPVATEDAAATPLFRRAGGAAIRTRETRQVVKALMAMLGLDARRFGAHSLRIGGASAALAAGLPPAAIRAAGRWASDVYEIYCRCSRQSAAQMAAVIGSTSFDDIERGVEFADEELLLTSAELPYGATQDFVEPDLIDDALED